MQSSSSSSLSSSSSKPRKASKSRTASSSRKDKPYQRAVVPPAVEPQSTPLPIDDAAATEAILHARELHARVVISKLVAAAQMRPILQNSPLVQHVPLVQNLSVEQEPSPLRKLLAADGFHKPPPLAAWTKLCNLPPGQLTHAINFLALHIARMGARPQGAIANLTRLLLRARIDTDMAAVNALDRIEFIRRHRQHLRVAINEFSEKDWRDHTTKVVTACQIEQFGDYSMQCLGENPSILDDIIGGEIGHFESTHIVTPDKKLRPCGADLSEANLCSSPECNFTPAELLLELHTMYVTETIRAAITGLEQGSHLADVTALLMKTNLAEVRAHGLRLSLYSAFEPELADFAVRATLYRQAITQKSNESQLVNIFKLDMLADAYSTAIIRCANEIFKEEQHAEELAIRSTIA